MSKASISLGFCLNVAKLQAELTRRLDSCLGGIGFNELIILYHLSQSPDQKLRRIDLAQKVGLTASGITRLLLPMEKIGLIGREANEHDARVSYATLAPGGATKLAEGLERAELFCAEMIPASLKPDKLAELSQILVELSKNI